MSSRVQKLLGVYRQHLTVPWQASLAAIQRVIFAVYDKADELRLRANIEEFALATEQAGRISRAPKIWRATKTAS